MSEKPPLIERIRDLDNVGAAQALSELGDSEAAAVLAQLNPAQAGAILEELSPERCEAIAAAAPRETGQIWIANQQYPDDSVGRLMERPAAVFPPTTVIRDAIEALRTVVTRTLVTYIFVTEADGKLVGVVTFREMLFAQREQTLADIMLRSPFSLRPEMSIEEAMREVVTRHFPAYPVTDSEGRLIGVARGQTLFEQQAFEISAQAGSMVGVEKEERLTTPWTRSFRFRHPWLQLNLLTAFLSAAVVGFFQGVVEQIVVLAVFLPVLAGQSGNTGCQALAVTLRGMTLGEMKPGMGPRMVRKEALLGTMNGLGTGFFAGLGMFAVAYSQNNPHPVILGLITWGAMVFACLLSGISGSTIPQILQRMGADPATASSIFLTTATDVVSMGCFLGLAMWLLT